MNNLIEGLFWEILFLGILGILYYFYQKRKILQYEKNKTPILVSYLLQSCLTERGDAENTELDAIISLLDDYLNNQSQAIPTDLLKRYCHRNDCSQEFRQIIIESLNELHED